MSHNITPDTDTTPVPSSGHTTIRRFRYGPDDRWTRFLAAAKARGTTGSAVIVERVDSYLDECEREDATRDA